MKTILKTLRWLLFPVVPIYFLVSWGRNKLYDWNILKSRSYSLPIICVGNLSTGGTGKTPMIEYLIRLLKSDFQVATLSRGYKRNSKGYILASKDSNAASLGDEPYQMHNKFNDISVAVDVDRQHGIEMLKSEIDPEVILLDDAFQHRRVKPGFSILLTPYGNMFTDDLVLPTGNLREPQSGAKRANVIVVTKCPNNIENLEKEQILRKLNPKVDQLVFFSKIIYANYLKGTEERYTIDLLKNSKICLVTGIANPKPLISYLTSKEVKFEHLNFPDHHHFSKIEIEELNTKDVILTTEKDYVRLKDSMAEKTKLYYLPIKIQLENSDLFDKLIKDYVLSYSQNS